MADDRGVEQRERRKRANVDDRDEEAESVASPRGSHRNDEGERGGADQGGARHAVARIDFREHSRQTTVSTAISPTSTTKRARAATRTPLRLSAVAPAKAATVKIQAGTDGTSACSAIKRKDSGPSRL
jgi:hypothetical protein